MSRNFIARPSVLCVCLLAVLSGWHCSTELNVSDNTVYQVGSLHTVRQEGQPVGRITLDTLRHLEHLYALGTCADLDGEVLIFDGELTVSQPRQGEVVLTSDWSQQAALLVFARVPAWREVELTEDIDNLPALERWLARHLAQFDLVETPFPFLLRGKAEQLYWHVIDLQGKDPTGDPLVHRANSPNGYFQEKEVEILGFFSQKHAGIWTEGGRFSHAHFITQDGTLAGHVDKLLLDGSMRLYLPDY